MSGGEYNYAYHALETLADDIEKNLHKVESVEQLKLRKEFVSLLLKCAVAAMKIEKVDSADLGPGDEIEALKDVLGKNL